MTHVAPRLFAPLAFLLHSLRRLYWRMFRPQTLGVAAIVLDQSRRFVLIRNSYLKGWRLPGGGVKRGETIAEAVKRELYEELGIECLGAPKRLMGAYSNFSDFNFDLVLVFVIEDWQQKKEMSPNFEVAEARFFGFSEVPKDLSPGSLRRLTEFFDNLSPAYEW